MPQTIRTLAVCALGALILACDDSPTEPGPAELVIVQAPSTVGAPGWELIDTLVIRAVDRSGSPRAGIEVTWTVRQGGGSIAPTADETDSDGLARAVWTLGGASGVNQVRASTLEGSQADFESSGEAFRVDRLVSSGGSGCGLVSGDLWCWGFVPNGPPSSRHPKTGRRSDTPVLIDGTHDFIDLAIGAEAVCALDGQLAVWCATQSSPVMALQGGLPPMFSLASNGDSWGASELCGLAVSDSTAWCWQVGQPATTAPGASGLARLWKSPTRGCGLRQDSTAVCWGAGPLGDGTPDSSDSAVAVGGGHRFLELMVGSGFACGRTAALEVWCWGEGVGGPDLLTPVLLETGSWGIGTWTGDMASYAPGSGMFRWLWNGETKSELGIATGLEGLSVVSFSAGNCLSCVLLADGQVYCYDLMWDYSSDVPLREYVPVQPVRKVPLTSVSP